MIATVVKFLGGFITKELILDVFKEVILEFVMELLEEFVKSTNNKYDDRLVEKFVEFLDERE